MVEEEEKEERSDELDERKRFGRAKRLPSRRAARASTPPYCNVDLCRIFRLARR